MRKVSHPPLALTSSCSHAFGPYYRPLTVSKNEVDTTKPRSILMLAPEAKSTLTVINVGFGTTGTRSVKDFNNRNYGHGCHHKCSPVDLVGIFESVWVCAMGELDRDPDKVEKCSSQEFLKKLKEIMQAFVKQDIHHFGDAPAPFLFAEWRRLVPNAQIQHSVRNPLLWHLKRIAEHRGELMCAKHTNSSNPFHIMECIEDSRLLQDNVVNTMDYTGVDQKAAQEYLSIMDMPLSGIIETGIHSETSPQSNQSFVSKTEQRQQRQQKQLLEANKKSRQELLSEWRQRHPNGERLLRTVAAHYATFNQFVADHTPPELYRPICVWDEDLHT